MTGFLECVKPAAAIFAPFWALIVGRRRVSVRAHRAFFVSSGLEAYFVTITNLSEKRDVEITHVWFDSTPEVPILRGERPLPKRLKPDEVWETWIPVVAIPAQAEDPYSKFRVRLSTGTVLKSVIDRNVPSVGTVPGEHNG